MGMPGEEREKEREEISQTVMMENFPKLNCGSRKLREHQTGQRTKNTTPRHIIFKLQKIKDKTLEEARGENTLLTEEHR